MSGATSTFDPGLADTLLFVVDLTNALPGTDGVVTISDLRVAIGESAKGKGQRAKGKGQRAKYRTFGIYDST